MSQEMNPDMKTKLRALLIKHEGYKTHPYVDTTGHVTIGIGRNLTDRGALPSEIDLMCENDSNYFFSFLNEKYSWFPKLNEARQIALIDMCFMGTRSFMEFEKMLDALSKEDYSNAAKEILNSEYRKEVGQRDWDIANIIKNGTL
jgi:lysozyme